MRRLALLTAMGLGALLPGAWTRVTVNKRQSSPCWMDSRSSSSALNRRPSGSDRAISETIDVMTTTLTANPQVTNWIF